jgi:predicted deacylase
MGAPKMMLHPAKFDPPDFARGAVHRMTAVFGDSLSFPILLARGARPGPVLVVTANVHGDEYEGVRAILETFEALDPAAMSGDLLAVPVVNGPAFWAGTRTSPLDGANLARVFPGSATGSPSEQLAWHLSHAVIARADFYLDLHSGGVRFRMPSMAGFAADDRRARAAAEIFGAATIWGHPSPVDPGRTVSFASDRGIPWIYTEARGAGRIHPEDLEMMKRGIRNLLRHLGIVPGDLERVTVSTRLWGNGNTDSGLVATQAGFLLKFVEVLQPVAAGDLLGRLVSVSGEALEEYRAVVAGTVALVREFPVVQPGEVLFLLADLQEGAAA